jgi:hypothetical protein
VGMWSGDGAHHSMMTAHLGIGFFTGYRNDLGLQGHLDEV